MKLTFQKLSGSLQRCGLPIIFSVICTYGLILFVIFAMRENEEEPYALPNHPTGIKGINGTRLRLPENISDPRFKDTVKFLANSFVPKKPMPLCARTDPLAQPLWKRDGYANLTSWRNCLKNDPSGFIANLRAESSGWMSGGAWKPFNCKPRDHVAVIIPYRNQSENLMVLLKVLHPLLQRHKLDYQIFVVEQGGDPKKPFNKGRLLNVGSRLAEVLHPRMNCFIFYDLDLVPEDERMCFECKGTIPVHLSANIDASGDGRSRRYDVVEGVLAITKQRFKSVNGYSNSYWDRNSADADIGKRILAKGCKIIREESLWFRFTKTSSEGTIEPRSSTPEPARVNLDGDGLNTLEDVGVVLDSVVVAKEFVRVRVNVGNPPEVLS